MSYLATTLARLIERRDKLTVAIEILSAELQPRRENGMRHAVDQARALLHATPPPARRARATKSTRKKPAGSLIGRVVALLSDQPQTHAELLARAGGLTGSQLSNVLMRLKTEKRVRKTANGWQTV
jgi:hypothetical protein